MKKRVPIFIDFCIALCYLPAAIFSILHYCLIWAGIIRMPVYLNTTPAANYNCLQHLWHTRIVRRLCSLLVRSPLRSMTLQIVQFHLALPADSGCILVSCHTPWKRLLVQWGIENEFGLLIARHQPPGGKGLRRIEGYGYKELRKAVQWLQKGKPIIIMGNVFNERRDCTVEFLDEQQNASLFPVRLAKCCGVPIITMIPVLNKKRISFLQGPCFATDQLKQQSSTIIQSIIVFLDNTIRKCPWVWPTYAG